LTRGAATTPRGAGAGGLFEPFSMLIDELERSLDAKKVVNACDQPILIPDICSKELFGNTFCFA
jgi:hypothetical protein